MIGRTLQSIALWLIGGIYSFYSRTWRVREVRRPAVLDDLSAPKVFAHWHGDELLLIGEFIGTGLAVLVSHSKDGGRLRAVLERWGYRVSRGSSSRGAVGGLKALIDRLNKEGGSASLAVDGPRGPLYQVKPGVLTLAQKTRAVLVPGAAACKQRFVFKRAWNQCYLPLPFSESVIFYGTPRLVPETTTPEEFAILRQQLETELLSLKAEAESFYQRRLPVPFQLQTTGV